MAAALDQFYLQAQVRQKPIACTEWQIENKQQLIFIFSSDRVFTGMEVGSTIVEISKSTTDMVISKHLR